MYYITCYSWEVNRQQAPIYIPRSSCSSVSLMFSNQEKTPSRRSRGTTFDFERPGDKPKVKVEYEKSKGDKDQNPRVGVRVSIGDGILPGWVMSYICMYICIGIISLANLRTPSLTNQVFHGTCHVQGENNPAKLVENVHCYSICLEGFIPCSAGFSGINSSFS